MVKIPGERHRYFCGNMKFGSETWKMQMKRGWFARKGHREKAGVELIERSKNFTLQASCYGGP